MMAYVFDLLRHGKVNGQPALYGSTDIKVSEAGHDQLMSHHLQLAGASRIISSPLQRCLYSAKVLASELDLKLSTAPTLAECHFGELDGIPFDDITEQWPLLDAFWQSPSSHTLPGAESLRDFHNRVVGFWERIIARPGGNHTVLVTHGGVIRQIIARVLGLDWTSPALYQQLSVSHASLTRITLADSPSAIPVIQFIGLPPEQGPLR